MSLLVLGNPLVPPLLPLYFACHLASADSVFVANLVVAGSPLFEAASSPSLNLVVDLSAYPL